MTDDFQHIIDPTTLTTAQLQREISSLKELVFKDIDSIKDSIIISHNDLVRVPTDVQQKISGLREYLLSEIDGKVAVRDVKLEAIKEKFEQSERVRIEQKLDTTRAVENTLIAFKEAVREQNTSNNIAINKSEMSFNKLLEQQGILINSITERFNAQMNEIKNRFSDQIDEVKNRITTIESMAIGALSQKNERRGTDALVIAGVGVLCAIIFGIIGYVIHHPK